MSKSYHNVIIQYGKSQVLEENDAIDTKNSKLKVDEIFSLKPSLLKDIEGADLIIGHAGAGTCLEGIFLETILVKTFCFNFQSFVFINFSTRGWKTYDRCY